MQRFTGHDLTTVLADGKVVTFELRQTVYEPDSEIEDVYFPLDSVLSVVTYMNDGVMIEIGTIGREGTTGIPLIMGSLTTANKSFCQVSGTAWSMTTPTFRSLLENNRPRRYDLRVLRTDDPAVWRLSEAIGRAVCQRRRSHRLRWET